jgi:hypothetical protein
MRPRRSEEGKKKWKNKVVPFGESAYSTFSRAPVVARRLERMEKTEHIFYNLVLPIVKNLVDGLILHFQYLCALGVARRV